MAEQASGVSLQFLGYRCQCVFMANVVATDVAVMSKECVLSGANDWIELNVGRRRCLESRQSSVDHEGAEQRLCLQNDVILKLRRIAVRALQSYDISDADSKLY